MSLIGHSMFHYSFLGKYDKGGMQGDCVFAFSCVFSFILSPPAFCHDSRNSTSDFMHSARTDAYVRRHET